MNAAHRIIAVLLPALLAGCAATPKQSAPEPVAAEPPAVYSDAEFLDLVRRYASPGGETVDYAAWKGNAADRAALERHIEQIGRISPENHPELFPDRNTRKGYWINAYNALVLDSVLDLWPLESVRDVKVSFSSRLVPGKGFFYDREVTVGGRQTNLYDLEKEVLKSQKDPRLHFALNCGSESCPVLRPWEWTDEQLDAAAREFINRPENVAVSDGKLWVSRIFKWYRRDFPDDLNGYLQQYAEPGLREELELARSNGYPTRYREYDWSLNDRAQGAGE